MWGEQNWYYIANYSIEEANGLFGSRDRIIVFAEQSSSFFLFSKKYRTHRVFRNNGTCLVLILFHIIR